MLFYRPSLFFLGIVIANCSFSQPGSYLPVDTTSSTVLLFTKYIERATTKARVLNKKFDKHSRKVLHQLQKQERKIENRLVKLNPGKATPVENTGEKYEQFGRRLKKSSGLDEYVPSLDTLSISLKFLELYPQHSSTLESHQSLKDAITSVQSLELEIQKAKEIKSFINERMQHIRDQLYNFRLEKWLKKVNKQVYYYGAQVNEYKTLLKDHNKAVRKAMELFHSTKLFRELMQKNSLLASIFRLPGDANAPVSITDLAGLQTRDQVFALLSNQILSGGPGAQLQFQENLKEAQTNLTEIKQKLGIPDHPGGTETNPGNFKPNTQKSRSFFGRLEFGTSIQSQKTHGYLPVTTDLALTIGYKLNDRSTIGLGSSYKLGWGKNIRHIKFTHQGVGLRSFMDWKIRGSLWLSGSYELNHYSVFESLDELKSLNAWQQSGLIGVSKMVSLKTKFFKKAKLQVLWDFLNERQSTRSKPILFRIGYNF